jgi:hypothetical protein
MTVFNRLYVLNLENQGIRCKNAVYQGRMKQNVHFDSINVEIDIKQITSQ